MLAKQLTQPAATTDQKPVLSNAEQYASFLHIVVAVGQVAKPDDELWPLFTNLLGRAATVARSLSQSPNPDSVVLDPQFETAMKALHVVIRKLRDEMIS